MTKPPLSTTQQELLGRLSQGGEVAFSNTLNGRCHYQSSGIGRGGESLNVKSADLQYLLKQQLVQFVRSDHLHRVYVISLLGKAWLDDTWTDPLAGENDRILASNAPPADTPFEEVDVDEEARQNIQGEVTQHPSFGAISLHHTQGTPRALFGCTVPHRDVISLEIHEAELHRSLSNDRHYARKSIVQVLLSYDQFISLIFRTNQGSGIPCTILQRGMERVDDPPPITSKRAQFTQEFKEQLSLLSKDTRSLAEEAERLLERTGPLKGEDKTRLAELLQRIVREVRSNLSFTEQQFQEQMDKTVAEAECQLQGALANKLQSLGLEALKNQVSAPQLEDPTKAAE